MTERSKPHQSPDSRNGEHRGGRKEGREGREGEGNLIPSHTQMWKEGNDEMTAKAK